MFTVTGMCGGVRAWRREDRGAALEIDMSSVNQIGSYKSSRQRAYGLRRSDQMIAETLVISAASASKNGGSTTSMT